MSDMTGTGFKKIALLSLYVYAKYAGFSLLI